ncbi:hypothetical protein [Pedobacter psychroterrae]|uniref:Uncharacterized protein n=1 Tax=Pedobacter psychroterrae TaxID=2530453 RepID=A0A4R0NCH5_9SPHI|nr:hypothetical protein [Pedobacter psychroterrae]TCC97367.1 hypothetical protein EZ437_19975 [Pedobacter psychroterrae]
MRKKHQSSKGLAKKYKLDDLLINQPYHKYLQALKELPELIGKSRNTLTNYRNILLDSKEMIPYEVGIIIERYFGIEPGTLSNI